MPGRTQPGARKSRTPRPPRPAHGDFTTLNVALVQGRNSNAGDPKTAPKVAIINEAFAKKYWPGESAVGKVFHNRSLDGPRFEVVGVCADYRVNTVGEKPTPY